eukprot:501731-Rhodomonas_salina.1
MPARTPVLGTQRAWETAAMVMCVCAQHLRACSEQDSAEDGEEKRMTERKGSRVTRRRLERETRER